jgi:glycerol uptake facilitator protein
MEEFLAEIIGTMLLILLGNGVVANVVLNGTKGQGGGWIVITVGWALGVFTGVIVAAPHSGAHLNPAVTFALALTGAFPWAKVGLFVLAQLLGAAIGATLVWLFYYNHYQDTADGPTKRATFCTTPAIRRLPFNFFCEVVGTFVLIFAILHFSEPEVTLGMGQSEKVGMGSLGAIPVTLVVLAIGLSLGGTTGYAINPARDLGPRIMHALLPLPAKSDSDWGYAWVPVAAPLVGAALAVGLHLAGI